MTNRLEIKVASDFTLSPGPRYISEGLHSGEAFREEVLKHKIALAIKNNWKLVIDLDNTSGYGTSFLEEAFGGLIRHNGFNISDILAHLEIISVEEDYLVDDIKSYLEKAKPVKRG
ncbi:MAG: STAS-like domain-containing protein [Candidatus Cloacimonetes bacterium]|nr:STAS-like domain-containing protein [Candidatus Cloacimonadota bacterium]